MRIGLTILFTLIYSLAFSQGLLISDDGTTSPDPSALLEMKSASLGFLPPRMTVVQMEAIGSPAEGMLVYNTSQKIPMVYDGSGWVDLMGRSLYENLSIGDYYQGGIVFFLDGAGGGYIAAPSDLDDSGTSTFVWGCQGTSTGANSQTDGAANTAAILLACSDTDNGTYITDTYTNEGYSDWFIPAPDQLDSMYVHRLEIGGFSSALYWTSFEANANAATTVDFSDGTEYTLISKTIDYRVRPMRSF